ncbi:MAG TPA: adenylate/guanylate cyclase domain-containing protein [Gallionellaceae bacterium]
MAIMKWYANKLLLGVTALFLLLALVETAWLHGLLPHENRLSDFFVRLQAQGLQPDPDIVIVDIDDYSLARMESNAGSWPWPRSVHGEMVQGIARQRPAAIIFDILFSEQDKYRPESDREFNAALEADSRIYFPMVRRDPALDAKGDPLVEIAPMLGLLRTPQAENDARIALLPPLAIAPRYWRTGTITFVKDDDGVGRRYQLYPSVHGWLIPSLPARVASDLGYQPPEQEDMILAWRGTKGAYKHISYAKLYEDFEREQPQRPQDELRGKIVFIGTDATGLHDLRVTPLASDYPGVEMMATALDNLKNHRMMQAAPKWISPLLTFALLGILALLLLNRGYVLRIGILLAAVTALMLYGSYAAVGRLYLLPVLTPLLLAWGYYISGALLEYLRERREREKTMREFSRFVNPHVVKELLAQGGLSRAGESRQITILFSDIRGFTTLSEKRTPQQIVSLLNRYFTLQVGVVFRHGGSLDKFIGDCIMAFWGAPLDDPNHARNAVAAALEMADVLQRFKQELGEQDAGFDVGIGIHSGPAVVGLIGSEQRREYTAIGDTVNLGSRIEGLTKGVSRILVSRETRDLCGDAFDFVPHGSFKVKGRDQEVELFEPRRKES